VPTLGRCLHILCAGHTADLPCRHVKDPSIMRVPIFATLLCALLPIALALPAGNHLQASTFASEQLSDETALMPVRISCSHDRVALKETETTFSRFVLYTSRVVGAGRLQWTLKTLSLSLFATEGNNTFSLYRSKNLLSKQGHISNSARVKRDTTTNTNNNTNTVNVNTAPDQPNKDEGLSKEAKIGIGVGVPAAVFALIGLFIACYKS
jgi:hypothetical protein